MNPKERWGATDELRKSLSVNDTFFADAFPGLKCLPAWDERIVIEHHGSEIVSVLLHNGGDRQTWDVAQMVSNRAMNHDPVAKHYADLDKKKSESTA